MISKILAGIAALHDTISQFVKYLLIGGSAFFLEYALFLLLLHRLEYISANILVYSVMFWLVFLCNRFLNFKSRNDFFPQLLRYSLLYILNLFLTNLLLFALTSHLDVNPRIGKIVTSACACLWNFPLYKLVIFRDD